MKKQNLEEAVKSVMLGEAKSSSHGSQTSIGFENIGGGLNLTITSQMDYKTKQLIGVKLPDLGMYSQMNDVSYIKPISGVSADDEKSWVEAHDIKDLAKDVKSLMDKFDNDISKILKKHKFEKAKAR